MEENAAAIRQVSEYQQEDANCKVLIDRYKSLTSEYKADLQRLDFISKGEKAVKGLTKNDTCPFCGGPIEKYDESYDAAIQVETKRIVSELAVIAATENSVREEQTGISKNIGANKTPSWDGVSKEEDQGKGYRSFLNSVLY